MNWIFQVDGNLTAFRSVLIRAGAVLLVIALAPVQKAAPAVAEEWVPVPEQSRIGFRGSQLGAPFDGEFKQYRASIVFDPDRLDQSQVSFIVEIDSVDTRNAERDAAIQSADWFDADAHPTATFVSEGFTAVGDNRYEAEGVLTMRGVTRPVVFPFSLDVVVEEGRQIARVDGAFLVARTEYGVGQGQWASDGVVGDRVLIQVDLMAVR
jgi:polyisoprenoid-binding protein YceI